MPKSKCAFVLCVFLVLAGAYCLPVAGFIPQGAYILELMTKMLGSPETLLVSQRLLHHPGTATHEVIALPERLSYKSPDTFRSDIQSANVQQLLLVSGQNRLRVLDGVRLPDSESPFDYYKDLLLYRKRVTLHKALLRKGVDVSVSSLGRYEEKPVYVIGARYPDESVSQLWVEKETCFPLRWLIITHSSDLTVEPHRDEILYSDWKKIDKTWYPMTISFLSNGHLAREIVVESVKENVGLPPESMDYEALVSRYPVPIAPAGTAAESGEVSEIQNIIESFKKIYE